MDDESWLEPEMTDEQRRAQEDAAIEQIVTERQLEKEIQPVGFIPATKAEAAFAELEKNNINLANMASYHDDVVKYHTDEAERLRLNKLARETYSELVEFLKLNRPMRYYVPNVGQEKAILPLKDLDPEKAEVVKGLFAAANMVGKTTSLATLLGGLIWGKGEMSPFFKDWRVFDKFEQVRIKERRRLKFRIVCHAAAMEDGGLMMEEIAKWWPKGLYRWEKNHKSYNSICKCWDLNGKELAVIQIRTQDQPKVAHAGDTLDGVFFDEPFPKHLWAENKARVRQKMGGLIWMFMSPLDDAGWVQELFEGREDINFTNAEIWDNCEDWHPEPRMWSGGAVGRGKVLTRGHVRANVIRDHMKDWEAEGPEIADARARGLFTHLAGSVFKEFDRSIHVIEPFKFPAHWPIYNTIDPHDAKPDFLTWAAQDERGNLYFFGELPAIKWPDAKGGNSFDQTAAAVREMEAMFRTQVVYRQGDPKRLEAPVAATSTTTSKRKEFAKQGLMYMLADNNVQVGTSRVRSMLMHKDGAKPKLFIMESNPYTGAPNVNMITCMLQLAYKKGFSEQSSDRDLGSMIQERWKDPFDCIRYTVMSLKDFVPVSSFKRKINQVKEAAIDRMARPWMR